MVKFRITALAATFCLAMSLGTAQAAPVTFTKLTGLTGGTLAQTAVYQADLSGLGFASVQAISILDNSGGLGGATGQFSGFDLDAIILSTTNCATAACVAGLAGIAVFDYPNAMFSPGTQRVIVDPKLFGTGPGGNTVDNLVATLGLFDAESTTGPGADGFLSMGDNGMLAFNLTGAVSTAGLFLYIGEVGDNGEVAAGTIEAFEGRLPEPSTLVIFGIGLAGLGFMRRRRKA